MASDPERSRRGADRGEISDMRKHNPLLTSRNYRILCEIIRGSPDIATLYTNFAQTYGRFRGGSGPRAGWSRRLSPDCQCLPIVPAADDAR